MVVHKIRIAHMEIEGSGDWLGEWEDGGLL